MSELADMVRRLRHDREPEYSFNEIEIRKRIEQLEDVIKALRKGPRQIDLSSCEARVRELDGKIEQLEAAITKYRSFVRTLECTNANCGLGSMKCSVCRIKEEPPEDET